MRISCCHIYCCSVLSHAWLFVTPWTGIHQAFLSFTISKSLFKFISIESVMPNNHLAVCRPLLLPSIFPSMILSFPVSWLFVSGGQSIGASASASAFQRIFRVDLLEDWLVWSPCSPWDSQECSPVTQFETNSLAFTALFMVWLSHLYMTIGKTIALTIQKFIGKVMFLLFNTLSRFVTAFLPRSKRLLMSWLWSLSAVILEPKKIVCHYFHFYLHQFAIRR